MQLLVLDLDLEIELEDAVKRVAAFLLVLLLVPSLLGAAEEPVRIFAAASLTDALAEALDEFEKSHPDIRVVPQFGGSSDLARQILAGAPADLFFSADVRQVERLEGSRSEAKERTNLLTNRLVVVRSTEREPKETIETADDLTKLERIAMADPDAVPAGLYTRLYLESKGLWTRIRPRVVPTLDVRGALAAVASGNVDAGFVYETDAAIESRVRIIYHVPRNEGPEIEYPLAIVGSGSVNRPEVRALYDFLISGQAREVFERYGFIASTGSDSP